MARREILRDRGRTRGTGKRRKRKKLDGAVASGSERHPEDELGKRRGRGKVSKRCDRDERGKHCVRDELNKRRGGGKLSRRRAKDERGKRCRGD